MSKKNQNFNKNPDMQIIQSILATFGLDNLEDTRLFTKGHMKDIDTVGKFFVDATGNEVVFTRNPEDDEAETTLILSSEDMTSLITGELSPIAAYTMGKLKVHGSMGIALKLSGILEGQTT